VFTVQVGNKIENIIANDMVTVNLAAFQGGKVP
jgi:hypothetical protein